MDRSEITVRPANPDDVELIVRLIRELADYEELAHECVADPTALAEHLFASRPYAEVLIALASGSPAGFALFFMTYSTFLTRPGIWLEDLFVVPDRRRTGVGRALLGRLAQIASERGCGRLEWSVLDWNQPAIDFYERLGARLMDGWTTCRVDGDALTALARAPHAGAAGEAGGPRPHRAAPPRGRP
ncbi:MAG: GNAT family N-acetyltransferase [Egibacteraceae bacterium]